MICPTCRRAGRFLALGEPEIAEDFHAKCPAVLRDAPLQCPCQHETATDYQNQEVRS